MGCDINHSDWEGNLKKNNAICVNSLQKAQFCNVVKNILQCNWCHKKSFMRSLYFSSC